MIKKHSKTKALLHTILCVFIGTHVKFFLAAVPLSENREPKRELTSVQLTLLTLSQSWVGKSLVLLSVPLGTHSCSNIGVKGVRKIAGTRGYGKNLYFTLLTSGFSRQYWSLFKARVSLNLETITEGWTEEKRMARRGKALHGQSNIIGHCWKWV